MNGAAVERPSHKRKVSAAETLGGSGLLKQKMHQVKLLEPLMMCVAYGAIARASASKSPFLQSSRGSAAARANVHNRTRS